MYFPSNTGESPILPGRGAALWSDTEGASHRRTPLRPQSSLSTVNHHWDAASLEPRTWHHSWGRQVLWGEHLTCRQEGIAEARYRYWDNKKLLCNTLHCYFWTGREKAFVLAGKKMCRENVEFGAGIICYKDVWENLCHKNDTIQCISAPWAPGNEIPPTNIPSWKQTLHRQTSKQTVN